MATYTNMADGSEMTCFPLRSLPLVSQYDLHVCFVCEKFFCFWMCLPIAVAPCSLRVLFAAPFKERLKAHLICKAPQFHKNPTQPLYIPKQMAREHATIRASVLPLFPRSPFWLNWKRLLRLQAKERKIPHLRCSISRTLLRFWSDTEGPIIIFLCFH